MCERKPNKITAGFSKQTKPNQNIYKINNRAAKQSNALYYTTMFVTHTLQYL